MEHAPKDARHSSSVSDGQMITQQWDLNAISATDFDVRSSVCVASGRRLSAHSSSVWLCAVCKHRAYEQEMAALANCPLCHSAVLS